MYFGFMTQPLQLSRRGFIGSSALAAAGLAIPSWARGQSLTHARQGFGELSGDTIDLSIGNHHFSTGGRSGHAIAVNGTVPGPLIRLREGQEQSRQTSSLHLDILRDLKRINAHLVAVAHPILDEEGLLIDSRLKTG